MVGRVLWVQIALAIVGPGVLAQIAPGTYASINSFEKVCLQVEEGERFSMFSSNCTIYREFEGMWTSKGDTLILNADNGPAMHIIGVTETPDQAEWASITLRSSDAHLLSAMTLSTRHQSVKVSASGRLQMEHPLDTIWFGMEGMASVFYVPVDPQIAVLKADIGFMHLDKPSLVNDRWLLKKRELRYLPGPHSNRSSEIALRRGKKCFYKP